MSSEFNLPSQADLIQRAMNSGRSPQQFVDMVDVVNAGMENGVLNPSISCYEHKNRWFEMARSFFVQNDYKRPITDVELGMHEAVCQTPTCKRLTKEYFGLTETTEDDSPKISTFLDDLERELVTGKARNDLIGTPSNLIDSDTDKRLSVIQAVDISHHCVLEEEETGVLTYTKPLRGIRVEIELRQKDRISVHVGYFLESSMFQPEDKVLVAHAERLGIDPHILFDIVNANAPVDTERPSIS